MAQLTWSYGQGLIDPAPHHVLGPAYQLEGWILAKELDLRAPYDAPPIPMPTGHTESGSGWVDRGGFSTLHMVATYPAGSVLEGKYVGAFVAKPDVIDPTKPLVIALHGYDTAHSGEPPQQILFGSDNTWGADLALAGYVVLAVSHLVDDELGTLHTQHQPLPLRVKLARTLANYFTQHMPAHTGRVVVGSAAGGRTAALMMALDSGLKAGVIGGSCLSLDFLRRNYGGEPHFNAPGVLSYLPYLMMAANRPLQVQMGKGDAFYPGATVPSPSDRDVICTEVLGEVYAAQEAAQRRGGSVSLHIHDGGHGIDTAAAIAFLNGLS